MRGLLGAVTLTLTAFVSSHSFAATVDQLQGTVSVNRGSGYLRINVPAILVEGNSVMAGPANSAEIVYENGCRSKVEPGSVAIVTKEPVCDGRLSLDAGGASAFAVGAIIAGGVVGSAVAIGRSRHDGPASP